MQFSLPQISFLFLTQSPTPLSGATILRSGNVLPGGHRPLNPPHFKVMGIPWDDVVVIQQGKDHNEPCIVTVNCPDKAGLGCDLCRIILEFGLRITRAGISLFPSGFLLSPTNLKSLSIHFTLTYIIHASVFGPWFESSC